MDKRYRVIDANINRAKEGLRVVEDICRFILDNEQLTDKIKHNRHILTQAITTPDWLLVNARDSDADVARGRDVPHRKSIRQTFSANMKRVTEALRVLEEFCTQSNAIKDIRYAIYDLEKEIYTALRFSLPFERDVYVVSDTVATLKQAVQDGAAIVQLRDKVSTPEIIYQKALEMVAFCTDYDVIFILNDNADLAVKVGADGVHIGQDTQTATVRKYKNLIVGKTTHNLAQAKQAVADGVNYISAGPVYLTPTKPGRPAVGLEYVREVAAHIDIPVVTIGGIDLTNLDDVLQAGAKTIGIVRQAPQTTTFLQRIRA